MNWLEKQMKKLGYKGCRNCKHQIDVLRACEWLESGGATAPDAYGYIAINLSSNGELNVWHDDKSKAIAAWNRRASDA